MMVIYSRNGLPLEIGGGGSDGNVVVVEDYYLEELLRNYFLMSSPNTVNYKNRDLNAEAESFDLNDGDILRFDVYGDGTELVDINVRRFDDEYNIDTSMLSQESLKIAYDSVPSGFFAQDAYDNILYVKKTTNDLYYLHFVRSNGFSDQYYFDSLQAFKDVVGTTKRHTGTGKYLYQMYTDPGFYWISGPDSNSRYVMNYTDSFSIQNIDFLADVDADADFMYKGINYFLTSDCEGLLRPDMVIYKYDDNDNFGVEIMWNGYWAGFEPGDGYLYLNGSDLLYHDTITGLDINMPSIIYDTCIISDSDSPGGRKLLSITYYLDEEEPYALMTYNNGYKNQAIKIDEDGMHHIEIETGSGDSGSGSGTVSESDSNKPKNIYMEIDDNGKEISAFRLLMLARDVNRFEGGSEVMDDAFFKAQKVFTSQIYYDWGDGVSKYTKINAMDEIKTYDGITTFVRDVGHYFLLPPTITQDEMMEALNKGINNYHADWDYHPDEYSDYGQGYIESASIQPVGNDRFYVKVRFYDTVDNYKTMYDLYYISNPSDAAYIFPSEQYTPAKFANKVTQEGWYAYTSNGLFYVTYTSYQLNCHQSYTLNKKLFTKYGLLRHCVSIDLSNSLGKASSSITYEARCELNVTPTFLPPPFKWSDMGMTLPDDAIVSVDLKSLSILAIAFDAESNYTVTDMITGVSREFDVDIYPLTLQIREMNILAFSSTGSASSIPCPCNAVYHVTNMGNGTKTARMSLTFLFDGNIETVDIVKDV